MARTLPFPLTKVHSVISFPKLRKSLCSGLGGRLKIFWSGSFLLTLDALIQLDSTSDTDRAAEPHPFAMLSLAFSLNDATLGFTVAPVPARAAPMSAVRVGDIEMAVCKATTERRRCRLVKTSHRAG